MAKNKFNLYDTFMNRTAKEGASNLFADEPKNIKNYFKMFYHNFSRIFSLNIIYVFGNFPIFFLILAVSGIVSDRGLSPQSSMFANLYGAESFSGFNPVTAALHAVHGVQVDVNVPGTATTVFLCLSLLLLFTFGYMNSGVTLSMREIMKGEPVYFFENIKKAIKNNKVSALVLGALDLVFTLVIGYDLIMFYGNAGTGNFMMQLFLGVSIVIALLYLCMRMYFYPLLLTFKLSIGKIIKNSFIFAIAGLKRNVLALLMIAAVVAVNYFILNLYMPIGIVLPIILTPALIMFTMTYAAWPKIKEIMIDPYYDEDGNEKKAD